MDMSEKPLQNETTGEYYLRTKRMRKKNQGAQLNATAAYGRVWMGCEHGNVPDTNMRLMCRDCFHAAMDFEVSET